MKETSDYYNGVDWKKLDRIREDNGLKTVAEIMSYVDNNTIYDPYSVIFGKDVHIGEGNIIYPNVTMLTSIKGSIDIKDRNIFYPGIVFSAKKGDIKVGSDNIFGTGFIAIQVSDGEVVTIGDFGRYQNGVQIIGNTYLGSGTQILGGVIILQNCRLGSGGSYLHPIPNERGALLKGAGLARGIALETGEVIQAYGEFEQSHKVMQSKFHK